MAKLDLSALDEEYGGSGAAGTLKTVPLSLIIEDPDQPRTEFNESELKDLAEDIKLRGLMQPPLVRESDLNGIHKIIVGARRYRACLLAGLEEIPVLVRSDETLDDYAQVAENTKREGLSALEMANFVAKRKAAGDKPADIARRLGIDKSAITQISALIDPPAFFLELYASGKCTNPLYFYEMKRIYNQWPDELEKWAMAAEDITRSAIQALYQRLRGPETDKGTVTVTEAGGLSGKSGLGSTDGAGSSGSAATSDIQGVQPDQEPPAESNDEIKDQEPETPAVTFIPNHNPDIESSDEGTVSDPNKIKKPLVLVEWDGRAAMLLLNRRPTSPGLVFIRYEDGGGDVEVEAGQLKINLLTDASK